MGMQVDESRGDNQARSVELARTIAGAELADLGNSAVLDSNIAAITGVRHRTTIASLRIYPGLLFSIAIKARTSIERFANPSFESKARQRTHRGKVKSGLSGPDAPSHTVRPVNDFDGKPLTFLCHHK
jgi:hypothetical protein